MTTKLEIPDDLIEFVQERAKYETIPLQAYLQRKCIANLRDYKETHEYQEKEEQEFDEEITEEDKQSYLRREEIRNKRAEIELDSAKAGLNLLKTLEDIAPSIVDYFVAQAEYANKKAKYLEVSIDDLENPKESES